ncbi:MAG TPA: hypothetical protein VIX83_00205 [Candidatus Cybelea sp.]
MKTLLKVAYVAFALCACSRQSTLPNAPPVSIGGSSPKAPARAQNAQRLFVSDAGNAEVYLYDVPSLKLVTILQGFARPQGECSNGKSEVFVTDGSANVVEELSYAGRREHQLSDSYGSPGGCAFDPGTENLAVFNYLGTQSKGGAVLVYHHASGSPNIYTNSKQFFYSFGGYDSSGNLYFDGSNAQGKFVLSELPANGGNAHSLAISAGTIYSAGMVQWDAASGYLDVGDQNCANTHASCIYQLKLSGKHAAIAGKITLESDGGAPVCDLVQGVIADGRLFGSDDDDCGSSPSATYGWKYPSGGAPEEVNKRNDAMPIGAAIAVNSAPRPDLNAKKLDLLYIVAGSTVSVYTYWQKTMVGKLSGFTSPQGECVDKENDVYITDSGSEDVVEYAHAGKKPLRTIDDSPYAPYGCASDPTTGNLAVANESGGPHGEGSITVFPTGGGKPTVYTDSTLETFSACAYDNKGNLLTVNGDAESRDAYFAWLPKGGKRLVDVTVPGPQKSYSWRDVTGLQWDGRYYVIDDYDLYRVSIANGLGYYIGATGTEEEDVYGAYALYNADPKKQATQYVGTSNDGKYSSVYFFNYPAGGDPVTYLANVSPSALAVSLGTVHE